MKGRSRLQPRRIGARGLNDPSLSLGSPPAASPPVSRFTTIRFLPPLRAFVLSYCLCCCFLREANVYTRLLCLPVCLFAYPCPTLCFSLALPLSFFPSLLALSVQAFPCCLRFSISVCLFFFFFFRLLLSSFRFSFFLSLFLSPFDYCWYSSIRTSIFAQVRNGGYRCNADTDTTEHLSLW